MRERLAQAVSSVLLSVVLLRGMLTGGVRLGVDTAESAGRVFVSAQVWRWFRGDTRPGTADLLAWPEGRTFWPVDPLVQVVEAPLQAVIGPDEAFIVIVGGLLAVGTYGSIRLARALGAGAWSSMVAGAAVTLSPFVLRNLRDGVAEALSLGVAAVSIAATVELVFRPSRRSAAHAFLAVLALAGCSPYFVVYLALGWLMALPFLLWRRARALGGLATVGALACTLGAAPLLWAEGGDDGRLGPTWDGGYELRPAPLVTADGVRVRPPATRSREAAPAGPSWSARVVPDPVEHVARRLPGGAALLALALGALAHPVARPWAALALAFLILGPGPGLVARALGMAGPAPPALLPSLLAALPVTGAMGNPDRMLAAWTLLAGVAGSLALRRRPVLLTVAVLAVFLNGELEQPRLLTPATRDPVPSTVLASLVGPTVVFPSGDPPFWFPAVGPKEALALAARADVPVAHDYGRGGVPADLDAHLALARLGRVPLGATAWDAAASREGADWSKLPFDNILLLEDRLSLQQRQYIRNWLVGNATLVGAAPGVSAWSWPASSTSPPPAR